MDPSWEPDGQTPLGKALKVAAEKIALFLEESVFPAEATVRNLEVMIVSDLKPTGETDGETEAGVDAFISTMKKYRGNVTLVAPDEESINEDLAGRLNVSERSVQFLHMDPKAILNITFDSLLQLSRKMAGSNPLIRVE